MSEPIVFYDIDRKITANEIRAWNPNCFISPPIQTTYSRHPRYTLNIKGIPYLTVWVEYPDIQAVCLKFGAAPAEKRPDGLPLYTLPAIYDPNTRTAVSDSAAIARYLDKTYPSTGPRLIPASTDALHAALQSAFMQTLFRDGHVAALAMPPSHAIMNEPSAAYFKLTREAILGKFEELAPAGSEKRRKHWEGLREIFGVFAGWLGTDGSEKLFFAGEGEDRIVYADVTVAAQLRWFRAVFGEGSEEWQDILRWDGGRWKRFMDAFEKYDAVDVGSVVEL